MTEETLTAVLMILFLLTITYNIYGCARQDIVKEAVRRGYATYDQQGEFIWKENIK